MNDQNDACKFQYLFDACDWLMGFKEWIDIRRDVEDTWFEVASRNSFYKREAIGSHGDGINFYKGNYDDMFVFNNAEILSAQDFDNLTRNKTKYLAIFDGVRPGYCMLQVLPGSKFRENFYTVDNDGQEYISSSKFMKICIEKSVDGTRDLDNGFIQEHWNNYVFAIPFREWPGIAEEWINRTRSRCWPSGKIIDTVIESGCHCVPVGHPSSRNKEHEWKIFFAVADRILMRSLDHSIFKLYQIMKIILSQHINTDKDCEGVLNSYIIRTLIFWVSEDKLPNFVDGKTLKLCIHICLTQLEEWVRYEFCPNYFMPQKNLFETRTRPFQRAKILETLSVLQTNILTNVLECRAFDNVKRNLNSEELNPLNMLIPGSLEMKGTCDFEFFRCSALSTLNRLKLSRARLLINNIENEIAQPSFNSKKIESLKIFYHLLVTAYAKIYFGKATSNTELTNKTAYSLFKVSHSLMKWGCASDVTSGKLVLASLYYCLGKYKKCIAVTNSVKEHIYPFTVYLQGNDISSNEDRRKMYMSIICEDQMPLSLKMRRCCLVDVELFQNTKLWPHPLNLELTLVEPPPVATRMPALVYLYFLRFLSFHTRNERTLKLDALNSLSAIMYDDEHCGNTYLAYNVVGICHEMTGNSPEAIEMFVHATRLAREDEWYRNKNPGVIRIALLLRKEFTENSGISENHE